MEAEESQRGGEHGDTDKTQTEAVAFSCKISPERMEAEESQRGGEHGDTDKTQTESSTSLLNKNQPFFDNVHVEKLADYQCVRGYRDKRTGICYLNAAQQTEGKSEKSEPVVVKLTRETQLCDIRNQCWNTTRETWTQMDRRDLVLDSSGDYPIYPGCYEDSKQWEEKRNKAATTIQRYARRRIAKYKSDALQNFVQERSQLFAEQQKNQKLEEDVHLKQEIYKHSNPRLKKDFDILYKEIESWHLEELKAIKRRKLVPEEKKLALQELLQKEIKFLQEIGKIKLMVAKENREEHIKKMFAKMSAPKKWELSNGNLVHVQTPATLRASDLMRLYTALAKCSRTVDERMCVLGYIKWTVQEFDCPLTKELVQLIEREADLMYRSRPTQSLRGLHQRILELFLKFVLVPQFNPEAANDQCIPVDFDHVSGQSLRRQNIPIQLLSRIH